VGDEAGVVRLGGRHGVCVFLVDGVIATSISAVMCALSSGYSVTVALRQRGGGGKKRKRDGEGAAGASSFIAASASHSIAASVIARRDGGSATAPMREGRYFAGGKQRRRGPLSGQGWLRAGGVAPPQRVIVNRFAYDVDTVHIAPTCHPHPIHQGGFAARASQISFLGPLSARKVPPEHEAVGYARALLIVANRAPSNIRALLNPSGPIDLGNPTLCKWAHSLQQEIMSSYNALENPDDAAVSSLYELLGTDIPYGVVDTVNGDDYGGDGPGGESGGGFEIDKEAARERADEAQEQLGRRRASMATVTLQRRLVAGGRAARVLQAQPRPGCMNVTTTGSCKNPAAVLCDCSATCGNFLTCFQCDYAVHCLGKWCDTRWTLVKGPQPHDPVEARLLQPDEFPLADGAPGDSTLAAKKEGGTPFPGRFTRRIVLPLPTVLSFCCYCATHGCSGAGNATPETWVEEEEHLVRELSLGHNINYGRILSVRCRICNEPRVLHCTPRYTALEAYAAPKLALTSESRNHQVVALGDLQSVSALQRVLERPAAPLAIARAFIAPATTSSDKPSTKAAERAARATETAATALLALVNGTLACHCCPAEDGTSTPKHLSGDANAKLTCIENPSSPADRLKARLLIPSSALFFMPPIMQQLYSAWDGILQGKASCGKGCIGVGAEHFQAARMTSAAKPSLAFHGLYTVSCIHQVTHAVFPLLRAESLLNPLLAVLVSAAVGASYFCSDVACQLLRVLRSRGENDVYWASPLLYLLFPELSPSGECHSFLSFDLGDWTIVDGDGNAPRPAHALRIVVTPKTPSANTSKLSHHARRLLSSPTVHVSIPGFHARGHSCEFALSVRFVKGAAWEGEVAEWINSWLSKRAGMTFNVGPTSYLNYWAEYFSNAAARQNATSPHNAGKLLLRALAAAQQRLVDADKLPPVDANLLGTFCFEAHARAQGGPGGFQLLPRNAIDTANNLAAKALRESTIREHLASCVRAASAQPVDVQEAVFSQQLLTIAMTFPKAISPKLLKITLRRAKIILAQEPNNKVAIVAESMPVMLIRLFKDLQHLAIELRNVDKYLSDNFLADGISSQLKKRRTQICTQADSNIAVVNKLLRDQVLRREYMKQCGGDVVPSKFIEWALDDANNCIPYTFNGEHIGGYSQLADHYRVTERRDRAVEAVSEAADTISVLVSNLDTVVRQLDRLYRALCATSPHRPDVLSTALSLGTTPALIAACATIKQGGTPLSSGVSTCGTAAIVSFEGLTPVVKGATAIVPSQRSTASPFAPLKGQTSALHVKASYRLRSGAAKVAHAAPVATREIDMTLVFGILRGGYNYCYMISSAQLIHCSPFVRRALQGRGEPWAAAFSALLCAAGGNLRLVPDDSFTKLAKLLYYHLPLNNRVPDGIPLGPLRQAYAATRYSTGHLQQQDVAELLNWLLTSLEDQDNRAYYDLTTEVITNHAASCPDFFHAPDERESAPAALLIPAETLRALKNTPTSSANFGNAAVPLFFPDTEGSKKSFQQWACTELELSMPRGVPPQIAIHMLSIVRALTVMDRIRPFDCPTCKTRTHVRKYRDFSGHFVNKSELLINIVRSADMEAVYAPRELRFTPYGDGQGPVVLSLKCVIMKLGNNVYCHGSDIDRFAADSQGGHYVTIRYENGAVYYINDDSKRAATNSDMIDLLYYGYSYLYVNEQAAGPPPLPDPAAVTGGLLDAFLALPQLPPPPRLLPVLPTLPAAGAASGPSTASVSTTTMPGAGIGGATTTSTAINSAAMSGNGAAASSSSIPFAGSGPCKCGAASSSSGTNATCNDSCPCLPKCSANCICSGIKCPRLQCAASTASGAPLEYHASHVTSAPLRDDTAPDMPAARPPPTPEDALIGLSAEVHRSLQHHERLLKEAQTLHTAVDLLKSYFGGTWETAGLDTPTMQHLQTHLAPLLRGKIDPKTWLQPLPLRKRRTLLPAAAHPRVSFAPSCKGGTAAAGGGATIGTTGTVTDTAELEKAALIATIQKLRDLAFGEDGAGIVIDGDRPLESFSMQQLLAERNELLQRAAEAGIAPPPTHTAKVDLREAMFAREPLNDQPADIAAHYKQAVLSDDERKYLRATLDAALADTSFSTIGNLHFKEDGAKRLRPTKWLTDDAVNVFLSVLNELAQSALPRGDASKHLHNWIHNTFFWAKLQGTTGQYDFEGVASWTRRAGIDLFAFKKILVPINITNQHWALAVIDNDARTVAYLDSMGGSGNSVVEALCKYMSDEHKDKKGVPLPGNPYTAGQPPQNLPRQHNGFDCGAFLCAFCELIVRGVEPSTAVFSQQDIPAIRERILLTCIGYNRRPALLAAVPGAAAPAGAEGGGGSEQAGAGDGEGERAPGTLQPAEPAVTVMAEPSPQAAGGLDAGRKMAAGVGEGEGEGEGEGRG
jgi:hypothetical protein